MIQFDIEINKTLLSSDLHANCPKVYYPQIMEFGLATHKWAFY